MQRTTCRESKSRTDPKFKCQCCSDSYIFYRLLFVIKISVSVEIADRMLLQLVCVMVRLHSCLQDSGENVNTAGLAVLLLMFRTLFGGGPPTAAEKAL